MEKQKELMEEYLRLSESTSEKDKEKAAAILKQVDNLGTAAKEVGKEVESAFATAASKAADKMQQIGNIITDTMRGIADIAKTLINQQETVRQQETAQKLADINRERNEVLLEIDNELSERREQKQIEDAEREEQRREEEYQKRLADSERNIQELAGSFQAETNLEKLRNLEKQLEAERKKKAEETARKKEEDEKKKRDKEARVYEITLLNAKSQAEHEFAIARIQTENASGDAAAKAAQQAAKWQKAQGVINMSIKGAEQTALAAVAIARALGGDPSGAIEAPARIAAAVAAGIQAGVIAGQPAPPDYIQQPLPPAPRPIKFAQGGIVMPSTSGTPIGLPGGNSGLVAEAGLPELILPINAPNLERIFRAAGIQHNDTQNQFSYAPSSSLTFSHNMQDRADVVMDVLKNHDRELFSVVEKARQNWFVE